MKIEKSNKKNNKDLILQLPICRKDLKHPKQIQEENTTK